MSNEILDEAMKKIGISLPQRQKLLNGLIHAQSNNSDSGATAHLPRASSVGKTLLAAGFDGDATDQILRAMSRAGHIADDSSVMQASATSLTPIQRQALKMAERYGIVVQNGSINSTEMDAAFARRSVNVSDRLHSKALFAMAGYID